MKATERNFPLILSLQRKIWFFLFSTSVLDQSSKVNESFPYLDVAVSRWIIEDNLDTKFLAGYYLLRAKCSINYFCCTFFSSSKRVVLVARFHAFCKCTFFLFFVNNLFAIVHAPVTIEQSNYDTKRWHKPYLSQTKMSLVFHWKPQDYHRGQTGWQTVTEGKNKKKDWQLTNDIQYHISKYAK